MHRTCALSAALTAPRPALRADAQLKQLAKTVVTNMVRKRSKHTMDENALGTIVADVVVVARLRQQASKGCCGGCGGCCGVCAPKEGAFASALPPRRGLPGNAAGGSGGAHPRTSPAEPPPANAVELLQTLASARVQRRVLASYLFGWAGLAVRC